MPTGLITLPLRLGVRSAKLALGVSERAVGLAWNVAQAFVPGHGSAPTHEDAPPFPRQQEADVEETERADEAQDESRVPAQNGVARDPRAEFELGDPRVASGEAPPAPELREPAPEEVVPEPEPEPEHVDTEATLVESFAEPGAEDGAGAELRIDEPFDGYRELHADDIIARLAQASPEELATIQLYEATSRQRSTVLAALEQELKARTAAAESSPGSQG